MNTTSKKVRLAWIDAAKALCIILMIIGHTIPYKSPLRTFIFSFHMPLFFILTGYTMKIVNDVDYIKIKVKRDFFTLVIPVLVLVVIEGVFVYLTKHPMGLGAFIIDRLKALFYSLGWDAKKPYIGSIWFLLSMFYARTLLRVIMKVVPSQKIGGLIVFALGIIAIYVPRQLTLPQNFMVNFVAMMFIYIGYLWKKYDHVIKDYRFLVLGSTLMFWFTCIMCGLSIEMSTRSYPYGLLCVIEAICGTYLACFVMEKLTSIRFFKTPLCFIGRETLLILEIYYLSPMIEYFGPLKWHSQSILMNNVSRLLAIFIVFGIVVVIKKRKISIRNVEKA